MGDFQVSFSVHLSAILVGQGY